MVSKPSAKKHSTKNERNAPTFKVPSFVYRQDGSELSYKIWEYYNLKASPCQGGTPGMFTENRFTFPWVDAIML